MKRFKDPVREFLKSPEKYDKDLPGSLYNKISRIEGVKLSFTRNRMAFEFGFNPKRINDSGYVKKHLEYIKDVFDAVIITEYYDESLLILREKFCWTYKDILYVKLRMQNYKEKNVDLRQEYGELYKNHEEWAVLDYKVYRTFLKIHKQRVKMKGPAFTQEVAHFQNLQRNVSEFCLNICKTYKHAGSSRDSIIKNSTMLIPMSKYHPAFDVTLSNCVLMLSDENWISSVAFTKQYSTICQSKSGMREKPFRARCLKNVKHLDTLKNSTIYGLPIISYFKHLMIKI